MLALPRPLAWTLFALALAAGAGASAAADKKTACTITVNSADEKEAFRRSLGPGQWEFVELVERGRPDWLESACRTGVRCDVLVISGHYDGGNEFFSDQIEAREFLPVDEMERVSCSDSCPGLFSQLKEVYLFGCDTLNAKANASPSAEIGRSLVRAGFSRADAERMTRSLAVRHAESSKDRMRLVFKNVPAIYGFSSVAPLGPVAGSILRRHFQSGGTSEVGSGRVSGRLLGQFSAQAMTVTSGLGEQDPLSAHRRDVCRFSDDRLPQERKVEFVHALLARETAEVRMFLSRLERFAATLDEGERESPAVAAALSAIARDEKARTRYLEFARDADAAVVRARMLALATKFGWLSVEEERGELVRMFNEQLASTAITPAEVDLACALNKDDEFDRERDRLVVPAALAERVPHAAILACLGSRDGRDRVLRALTSPSEDEVKFAQVYLRHRPLADRHELRTVMEEITRMGSGQAQMRALHAFANHRLSDPESLDTLMRLYPVAESVGVQTAIAGILLRAEYRTIASPALVETLRTRRLKSPGGEDAIDILIRRMQMHYQTDASASFLHVRTNP
jgi:hypothetical protein